MRIISYIVLFVMTLGITGTFADDGWFFEAESIDPVSPWVFMNETPGYTGTGYFFNSSTKTISSGGDLQYKFTVKKPGIYIADLHGRRDQEGACLGEAGDQCNDVSTKWDNGPWRKTMVKSGGWGK